MAAGSTPNCSGGIQPTPAQGLCTTTLQFWHRRATCSPVQYLLSLSTVLVQAVSPSGSSPQCTGVSHTMCQCGAVHRVGVAAAGKLFRAAQARSTATTSVPQPLSLHSCTGKHLVMVENTHWHDGVVWSMAWYGAWCGTVWAAHTLHGVAVRRGTSSRHVCTVNCKITPGTHHT